MPESRPSINHYLSVPEPALGDRQPSMDHATSLVPRLERVRADYCRETDGNQRKELEQREKRLVDEIKLLLEAEKSKSFNPSVVHSRADDSIVSREKKRLFVCCDGTWKNAAGTVAPLTNVGILARCVEQIGHDGFNIQDHGTADLDNPDQRLSTVHQVVYYSSGVGTQSSLSMDSGIAGATGHGIRLIFFEPNVKANGYRRGHRKHLERLLLHLQQLQFRL